MEIQLNKGLIAIVDPEDYEFLSQFQWKARCRQNGLAYAYRGIYQRGVGKRSLLMHRVIMAAGDGIQIDHVNGNGLDNRRANLRKCTHAENLRNRGKSPLSNFQFKGIGINRRISEEGRRYYATISIDGQRLYSRSFHTEMEAAIAYDELAIRYHGEFAHLNFPK